MKILKRLLWLCLLVLALFSLFGCLGNEEKQVYLQSVTLSKSPETPTYEIGKFVYADYEFTALNSDGTGKTFALTADMLSDYDRMQLLVVGTHTLTAELYGFKNTFTVTVTAKAMTEDGAVRPYLENMSVTYDGQPHTMVMKGDLPAGATVTYLTGPTFTSAGSYVVTATVSAENYETVTVSAVMEIKKATYDLSGVVFQPDYGVDEDGKPLSGFVYDGFIHEVTVKGNVPDDLSVRYEISTVKLDDASYEAGNGAVNAGMYFIRAIFTSTNPNYEKTGLTLETTLYIDKKQVSRDFLEGVTFGTKEVVYDGQEHRFTLQGVTLPEGIHVEYLDEFGNVFGSRVEANEEGYVVIPHFINAKDGNSEILTDLRGLLIIHRKEVAGASDVSVTFENNKTTVEYTDLAHTLSVINLPAQLTVKSITCEGLDVTSFTHAGTYNVVVDFEELNANYVQPTPITVAMTVEPTPYVEVQDSFPEETVYAYDPTSTVSYTYESYVLPTGFKTILSYVDLDGVEHEGLPTGVSAVGTYVCRLTYDFTASDYSGLPEDFATVRTAKLVIEPRVFDTATISTPTADFDYDATVDWSAYMTPRESFPGWVRFMGVKVSNMLGEVVPEARRTGKYAYTYVFSYFNGVETVTAETESGTLTVHGVAISPSFYNISYAKAGNFDGTTSFLPTVTLKFSEVTTNVFYQIAYQFRADADAELQTVDKADYESTSKRAGRHVFTVSIYADDYDPYETTFTVEVAKKVINVSTADYTVDTSYTFDFDNVNHTEQLVKIGTNPELVHVTPVTVDRFPATTGTKTAGLDVGTYFFKVKFTSNSSDYEVVVDDEDEFLYTVKINGLNVETDLPYEGTYYAHLLSAWSVLAPNTYGNYNSPYTGYGFTFKPRFVTASNLDASDAYAASYLADSHFTVEVTNSKGNVLLSCAYDDPDFDVKMKAVTVNPDTYTVRCLLANDNVTVNETATPTFTYTVTPIEVTGDLLHFYVYDAVESAYEKANLTLGAFTTNYQYKKPVKVVINPALMTGKTAEEQKILHLYMQQCELTVKQNGKVIKVGTIEECAEIMSGSGTYNLSFATKNGGTTNGGIVFYKTVYAVTVKAIAISGDVLQIKNGANVTSVNRTSVDTFSLAGVGLSGDAYLRDFDGAKMYTFTYTACSGFFNPAIIDATVDCYWTEMPGGIPLVAFNSSGKRVSVSGTNLFTVDKNGAFTQHTLVNKKGNGIGTYYLFYTVNENVKVDGNSVFVVKIEITPYTLNVSDLLLSGTGTTVTPITSKVTDTVATPDTTGTVNLSAISAYTAYRNQLLVCFDVNYSALTSSPVLTLDLTNALSAVETDVQVTTTAYGVYEGGVALTTAFAGYNGAYSIKNDVLTVKIGNSANAYQIYSGYYFIAVDTGDEALTLGGSQKVMILVRVNPDSYLVPLTAVENALRAHTTTVSGQTVGYVPFVWSECTTYDLPTDFIDKTAYDITGISATFTVANKFTVGLTEKTNLTVTLNTARYGSTSQTHVLQNVYGMIEKRAITFNRSASDALNVTYYGETPMILHQRLKDLYLAKNIDGYADLLKICPSLADGLAVVADANYSELYTKSAYATSFPAYPVLTITNEAKDCVCVVDGNKTYHATEDVLKYYGSDFTVYCAKGVLAFDVNKGTTVNVKYSQRPAITLEGMVNAFPVLSSVVNSLEKGIRATLLATSTFDVQVKRNGQWLTMDGMTAFDVGEYRIVVTLKFLDQNMQNSVGICSEMTYNGATSRTSMTFELFMNVKPTQTIDLSKIQTYYNNNATLRNAVLSFPVSQINGMLYGSLVDSGAFENVGSLQNYISFQTQIAGNKQSGVLGIWFNVANIVAQNGAMTLYDGTVVTSANVASYASYALPISITR